MRYDHIIVGGGSAGAVLAARLSEDPSRSVLLLDAGRPYTGPEAADALSNVTFAMTSRDWGIRAVLAEGRELDYPQGKAFGGGSSVNGALAMRGEPADYEGWAGPEDDRWGWAQLCRAFRRLERDLDVGGELHGADGPIPIRRWRRDELVPMQEAFAAACQRVGFRWVDDHNVPDATGVSSLPMNRQDGIRISTAIGYLDPALGRANLTLMGDAHVARIVFDGGRATGVQVAVDGRVETLQGGEVVVSAGAVNSPALLLRSGVGAAADLDRLGIPVVADVPGVGQNLMDHPGVFLLLHPAASAVDMTQVQFQLGVRFTSTRATRPNDLFMGLMNYWDLTASPDFQAMLGGVPMVTALTCGLHAPRSRGRVSLVSADPDELPHVDLNMLADPADVELLVEGLRRCWDVARADEMAALTSSLALLEPSSFEDDEALRSYVRSMVAPWYHPSGTCRMGPASDEGAVVDGDLRVRGVDGLRVVDASVLPTIPRAPTNLTVIAVAERAAELLRA